MTKFRGYRFSILWIALNDEPGDTDPDSVASYTSTLLVADLFSKDPNSVADAIVKIRLTQKETPND